MSPPADSAGRNTTSTVSPRPAATATSEGATRSRLIHAATTSWPSPSSPSLINTAHWQLTLYIEFSDGSSSSSNTLDVYVTVSHNGSPTVYHAVDHDGTLGSISCGPRTTYSYFTADVGDVITVTITGTNTGSATIKATAPTLWNVT